MHITSGNQATITYIEVSNNAAIKGTGNYVGGISGSAEATGYKNVFKASECRNTGAISGKQYVGGLCGYAASTNAGTIVDSTATGKVTGTSDFGAIVGLASNVTLP